MRVLYLHQPRTPGKEAPLYGLLKTGGNQVKAMFTQFTEMLVVGVEDWDPDITVSFNYHYRVPKEVLALCPAVNLHISYLPWNRGCHPNFWAAWDGTQNGVAVHYMDEGFDTGPIIARRKIRLEMEDTLRTSHRKLEQEVIELFKEVWPRIKDGTAPRHNCTEPGSYHGEREIEQFFPLLPYGWSTNIWYVRRLGQEHQHGV